MFNVSCLCLIQICSQITNILTILFVDVHQHPKHLKHVFMRSPFPPLSLYYSVLFQPGNLRDYFPIPSRSVDGKYYAIQQECASLPFLQLFSGVCNPWGVPSLETMKKNTTMTHIYFVFYVALSTPRDILSSCLICFRKRKPRAHHRVITTTLDERKGELVLKLFY